ncbi:MAG: AAA family ATPase [Deltaproteobacteria bacterium]|nr:AAA family ATPase [Deltaproteobacteria bacterium]
MSDANNAFSKALNPNLKEAFARLCLATFSSLGQRAGAIDPSSWLQASTTGIDYLVPRPPALDRSLWLELLNKFPLDPVNVFSRGNRVLLLQACLESNGHPTTIRLAAIAFTHHFGPHHDETELSEARRLAREVTSLVSATEGRSGWSAILAVFGGDLTTSEETDAISAVGSIATEHPDAWVFLVDAVRESGMPRMRRTAALARVLREMGVDCRYASYAFHQLRELQQRESSSLDVSDTWSRLTLPNPPPASTNAPQAARVPEAPVTLSRVALRDVRGLSNLQLTFPSPPKGRGQWIVLLGPNGVGKTTILRSIALACRNAQDPAIWPDDAFAAPWPRMGTDEARVVVEVGGSDFHESRLRADTGPRVTQVPVQTRERLFPLFGYGCRRGSALGGRTREATIKTDGGPEVATLFSEARDLIHAETWILILDGDAGRSPRSRDLLAIVLLALKKLLDVAEIEVDGKRLWVTERHGARIPFESMSDGYLTTAGWFLDFVARWSEMAEEDGRELSPDFLSHARGLVLIDEFDLHLHPQWQMTAISRVREILPQMSFVVTTHNPLTLVGVRADETWILSRGPTGIEAVQGTDPAMLLTSGQILRQYFGIGDLKPDLLGRQLDRHGFLANLAARSDQEDSELAAISGELAIAGIVPPWPTVARSRRSSKGRKTTTSGGRA